MRRRDALKSMAALSAVVRSPEVLLSQQPPPRNTEVVEEPGDEPADLAASSAEEVSSPQLRFFQSEEMAIFRRLADVVMPRTQTPGALDAGAPEFLDFYLSFSRPARQNLYRSGVTQLNAEARRHFGKAFTDLSQIETDRILAPLREPWPPSTAGMLAVFLRAAKEDLVRATLNSRVWALGVEGRRGSAGGTYWYPVE